MLHDVTMLNLLEFVCVQTFYGNTDSDTVVSVFFNQEEKVQYVRMLVEEWSNEIGLRFDILGCPGNFPLCNCRISYQGLRIYRRIQPPVDITQSRQNFKRPDIYVPTAEVCLHFSPPRIQHFWVLCLCFIY